MQFRHPYAFECIADSPGCRTVASTSQLPDAPRLGCPCLSCPACNTHLRTSWADARYGARRRATRRSPCQSVGSRVCPLPNADSNVANDDFPEIATALRSRASWRSTAHSMSLRRWQPVNSAVFGGGRRLEPRGGRPSAKRHASGWDGSMPWNESATSLVRCPLLPHGFPPESRNPAGMGSTRTASWPGQTIPCRCAAAPGCLAPTGVDRIVDRLRAPRHFLPRQAMDSGSGARCRVHPSDGSGPRGMPGPVSETSEKGKQPATGMGSSPQLRWAIAAL
jgi:hypothetical protein